MKANINTLKQALTLTCKAHNNTLIKFYDEDNQIGIFSTHTPILTDVREICDAFFGSHDLSANVDEAWGFITIYTDVPFLPEVNIEKLDTALPFGWITEINED